VLHRITLRVLPALTLAVTEKEQRRRKRILMLFPGLVAFIVYRLLQSFDWHSHIVVLLVVTGLYSYAVAIVSYVHGRQSNIAEVVREDGAGWLAWFGFRYGFLYAIQLAFMVLALLKLVSYSYLQHPDGPAMMALIIASTSVARDAFELGYVRLQQHRGGSISFPDPRGFWNFVVSHTAIWGWPALWAASASAIVYIGLAMLFPWAQTDLGQLFIVGLMAGVAATGSYVMALQPTLSLWESVTRCRWRELAKFFLWPGVVFGWTYDLILLGMTSFVLGIPQPPLLWRVTVTVSTATLMVLYCYYLGRCRWQEEKLHAAISPSMLRCPFIAEILTSKKA
jgi:hypothetical protein